MVVNPHTGVFTFIHGVKPGALPAGENGLMFGVQRATALSPEMENGVWNRFPNEFLVTHEAPWEQPTYFPLKNEYWGGGQAEASILYESRTDKMVLFYEAKRIEGPDEFGQKFRGRIGRAEAPARGFDTNPKMVKTPPVGPKSYVFDPAEQPNYGTTNETAVWGTAHVTLRSHISRNPCDGRYHMLAINSKPNTGTGKVNSATGIGHWYSEDMGLSWNFGSKVVDWGSMGFTKNGIANKFNSPFIMWDMVYGKMYVMFWANNDGVNKLGNKLYAMEAPIPGVSCRK